MRSAFRFTSELDDVLERVWLTDLAVVLSRDEHVQCEFGPVSLFCAEDSVLYITTAYQGLMGEERMKCLMADLYLRAAGSKWFTDQMAMVRAKAAANATDVPMLVWQFVCVVEDVRLAARVIRQRPGTAPYFACRTAFYKNLFARQKQAWARDGRLGNVCFAELYDSVTDLARDGYARAAACETSDAAATLAMQLVQEKLDSFGAVNDLNGQWFDYRVDAAIQRHQWRVWTIAVAIAPIKMQHLCQMMSTAIKTK
ncbi:hypothetical protein GCM10025858_02260 [Alicyclobacillus sacchari]|uniref:hypothetical protein n=1 Tax=Alicyclobacillus sacchari TaxID=392010 RepID=UPI0023E9B66B|nr:hypothetical protein [Alicyclobacillus sacchari]GMA55723.1 hypothetical protein GCM10025858_02260 [Alicyclobacillus sacchari]